MRGDGVGRGAGVHAEGVDGVVGAGAALAAFAFVGWKVCGGFVSLWLSYGQNVDG